MSRDEDPLFSINERPLCFSPPLYYDVEILKHRIGKTEHQYFIHYLGWKNSYDTWVPEQQLIKRNKENLQRQADAFDEEKKRRLRSRKTKAKSNAKPAQKMK